MDNNDIYFMSGFPRAGSTLLMNILAQNPKLLPTATSGLISSVLNVRNNWRKEVINIANDEVEIYQKIKNMMRGMIYGYYNDAILDGKIPIDKNRIWVGSIDLLDELFNTRVKFIYPIRDVIDCLISFEKIHRKSSVNNINLYGNDPTAFTSEGRAEMILADKGVVGLPIMLLREIIKRGELDRLIFVEFNTFLNNPQEVMLNLYNHMGLEPFNHDFNNITQVLHENDVIHGYSPNSLHKIKEGELMGNKERDLTVFEDKYVNHIQYERYGDISDLMHTLKNNNNNLQISSIY